MIFIKELFFIEEILLFLIFIFSHDFFRSDEKHFFSFSKRTNKIILIISSVTFALMFIYNLVNEF